jgi:hypothetical protein
LVTLKEEAKTAKELYESYNPEDPANRPDDWTEDLLTQYEDEFYTKEA